MRQTPSDQSHHLHLHIWFANVNGKGIAEATWNFGGRSQGRWNKGLSYIYQRAQQKLGKIHLRFLGHLHISELVKFGMGSGWDRQLEQETSGDTWNHLKHFEITWIIFEVTRLWRHSQRSSTGSLQRPLLESLPETLRLRFRMVSTTGLYRNLLFCFFATTMSFLPSALVHF